MFCKICNGDCFGTHTPVEYCFHEMQRVGLFKPVTQCRKCLFQLPYGMTWIPISIKELLTNERTTMKYGKTHTERELMNSNEEIAEQKINKLLKQGAKAERKRIIKLIENQHNFDQIFLDAVDKVIALIKGELSERKG